MEIEDSREDYYIELDAIELIGRTNDSNNPNLLSLDKVKISDDECKNYNRQDNNKFYLSGLPDVILNIILRKLDLLSLLRLRSTCK